MPTNNVTFTEITFSPTGSLSGYRNVAIADFNGDGQPDAVLPNSNDKNVSILLSDSKGGFNAESTFATGITSTDTYITINDFNGDGKADFVLSTSYGGSISVLLNDGSGGFSAPTVLSSGSEETKKLIPSDFNADGKADLFVPGRSAFESYLLLNDGNGSFKAPAIIEGIHSVAQAGDFNGDGKLDIVSLYYDRASANRAKAILSLGNGSGGFSSQAPFALEGFDNSFSTDSIESFSVGDFNGDGRQDLAVEIFSYTPSTSTTPRMKASGVSILLNNGSGGFTAKTSFAAAEFIGSIAVGDFNGDGKTDIATSQVSRENMMLTGTFVYLNDGSGSFSNPTKVSPVLTYNLAASDFNKDGKSDLTGF
jgi:hypothetical protein